MKGVGECDDADTKSTFSQTRLKEVRVNYIENELCTSPTFGYPSGSITDSMMCAIGDEYISTMVSSFTYVTDIHNSFTKQ